MPMGLVSHRNKFLLSFPNLSTLIVLCTFWRKGLIDKVFNRQSREDPRYRIDIDAKVGFKFVEKSNGSAYLVFCCAVIFARAGTDVTIIADDRTSNEARCQATIFKPESWPSAESNKVDPGTSRTSIFLQKMSSRRWWFVGPRTFDDRIRQLRGCYAQCYIDTPRRGITVLQDVGGWREITSSEMLHLCDYLLPNESELNRHSSLLAFGLDGIMPRPPPKGFLLNLLNWFVQPDVYVSVSV